MKRVLLLLFATLSLLSVAQPKRYPLRPPEKPDLFFLAYLMQTQSEKFQYILNHKDELEVQIIYTQINRDANNRPTFKEFYFNVDSTRYFYPASTVKLPAVLLSLEKLTQLNITGLSKYTAMFNDSVYSGQISARTDPSSETGVPSLAHYIKKILLVSHNEAYNRLYEFIGQKAINETLKAKGYNIQIVHRLDRSLTPDQNRHTESIRFMNGEQLIYQQPMLVNADSIKPFRVVKKGSGYIRGGKLMEGPFDFTGKNVYPLEEQQRILKAILFPDRVPAKERFHFSEEDRQFVMKYMSQLPTETPSPAYAKDTVYYDSYCKYLLYGDKKDKIPSHIRIFNKVGNAYGYMIDNAYIVDFEKGIEFMLSAVINTNTDGIYNDNKYEYTTIGFPFMKNLGQLIYNYELKRARPNPLDLSEFKMEYDHP